MAKKRSVSYISYALYLGRREVNIGRRGKDGKLRQRCSVLTAKEANSLVSHVNSLVLNRQGFICAWSNGWSFYYCDFAAIA